MSLRPIVCDFLSVVTLQSFLLGRFERLVFRPPTVLEKPFWAPPFRFHRFDYDSERPTSTDVSRTAAKTPGKDVYATMMSKIVDTSLQLVDFPEVSSSGVVASGGAFSVSAGHGHLLRSPQSFCD
jgi:hypothetical protein